MSEIDIDGGLLIVIIAFLVIGGIGIASACSDQEIGKECVKSGGSWANGKCTRE